jgi:diguanylate cyclase (GGDEF)-like protein
VPHLLIADQPSPERDELVAHLGSIGHRITVAEPSEVMARWRAERPELLLLDGAAVGFEAVARLKAEPGMFVPVVLVVAAADRLAALAVADEAVTRPYDAVEVAARCEALLRTRRLVDELRAARAESEARSIADTVTGLRNRVFLGERLNEEFKRSARYNEPLSLLVASLDGHRQMAETRGTAFGDRTLGYLAAAALRSLRQIDVVTRFGPSEVAALLPNTHFIGSLTCAERLWREIARGRVDDVTLSASMGVAFYPGKDVSEPADLIRLATRALERAREEGPARICLVQHQGYLFQPR